MDPHAGDLHLLVRPALDDEARTAVVAQIAGGEPPAIVVAVEVRILPVEVAAQGEWRADVNFPGLQPVAGARQRHTDGAHAVVAPFGCVGEELRQGRLARAVEVDNPRVRCELTQGHHMSGVERLAGEEGQPERFPGALRPSQPPCRETGNDVAHGDALGGEKRSRVTHIVVAGEDECRATAEGNQFVPEEHVEGGRRQAGAAVAGTDTEGVGLPGDELRESASAADDSLRRPVVPELNTT
ncbi:hypothetical protein QWU43_04165 [Corynebacterium sp. CCM 9204]